MASRSFVNGLAQRTLVLLFLAAAVFSSQSFAITIQYEATDLVDVTAGEDLWRYTYEVSDVTFNQGVGFSIYFDYGLYENLQNATPSSSLDWDTLTLQPDLFFGFSVDGIYDVLALTDAPDTQSTFSIETIWNGTGAPGEQFFELYSMDLATGANFTILDSGFTTLKSISVPEPASLWLLVVGLFYYVLKAPKMRKFHA